MEEGPGFETGKRNTEEGDRGIYIPLSLSKPGARKTFLLVGLICLLTGCITQKPDISNPDWQLRGRVGIRTAEDAASFSLVWQQKKQSFDVRLTGALGVPVAHIFGDEAGVAIEVPKRGRFTAGSASDLLYQHTGLILPLESLRFWVRGDAAPGSPFKRDESSLRQAGWQIQYLAHNGTDPVRMKLIRPEVSIQLVVNSWIY